MKRNLLLLFILLFIIPKLYAQRGWKHLELGDVYLNDVYSINPDTIFIVGRDLKSYSNYKGIIFKTTDGGMSWEKDSLNLLYDYDLRGVSFANKDTGLIVGGVSWL